MYGVKETQLIYPTQSVRQENHKSVVSKFNYALPNILLLRDGELVLYKRKQSPYWQCTFKLQDGQRVRISTKKASIENATTAACEIYDESRFRQRLGLAHRSKTFSEIAHETLNELHKKIDLGKGKTAIEVANADELIRTLELVKSAVEGGELDTQIESVSGALREGFIK
jgi:hypothetical protein